MCDPARVEVEPCEQRFQCGLVDFDMPRVALDLRNLEGYPLCEPASLDFDHEDDGLASSGPRWDGEGPELARELSGIESGARRRPILRRELEMAIEGPLRMHADHFGEIGFGIKPMELARCDEREEVASGLGVVIGTEEEPSLSTYSDVAESALGSIVVHA